jgi:hypothetical protein
LAEAYLTYVERDGAVTLPDNQPTLYGLVQGTVLKVFVQERLVNLLLLERKFRVVRPDYETEGPVTSFYNRRWARWLYGRCDAAKRAAAAGRGRPLWLGVFHVLRLTIAALQRVHDRLAPRRQCPTQTPI